MSIVNISSLTNVNLLGPPDKNSGIKITNFGSFFRLYNITYNGGDYIGAMATDITGVIDPSISHLVLPCPPYCSNKRVDALISKTDQMITIDENPLSGVFSTAEVLETKGNNRYVHFVTYGNNGQEYGFVGGTNVYDGVDVIDSTPHDIDNISTPFVTVVVTI